MGKQREKRTPRVLVALDGSPAAASAIPTAQTLARQLGADLEAVHVAPSDIGEEGLENRLGLGTEAGRGVKARLLMGDPVEQLLNAARERGVVFIVLATHGHTIGEGARLAPVPEALAACATRPTLLVRPEAATMVGNPPPPFKRMLFPFDGTPVTSRALKPAFGLAGKLGAAVDLLYLVHAGQGAPRERGAFTPSLYMDEPYYEWPMWESEAASRIRSCCGDASTGVPIDVYVRGGLAEEQVGEAIANFAYEHEHDAIGLVRRSHLEPGRAPILRSVLDLTPCPVLLVAGPVRGCAGTVAGYERGTTRPGPKALPIGWRNWERMPAGVASID